MRTLKSIAAAALLAAATASLYYLCIAPYTANIQLVALIAQTQKAIAAPQVRGAIIARQNIEKIRKLMVVLPTSVDLYMLLAANYRIVGENGQAREAYNGALDFDRRPEIYFNLGMLELQEGQRDAAIRDFAYAVRFEPPLIDEISEESLQKEILAAAARLHR
jgi:Flp pilus assembly protein TadD